jgi:hypothetical protein
VATAGELIYLEILVFRFHRNKIKMAFDTISLSKDNEAARRRLRRRIIVIR